MGKVVAYRHRRAGVGSYRTQLSAIEDGVLGRWTVRAGRIRCRKAVALVAWVIASLGAAGPADTAAEPVVRHWPSELRSTVTRLELYGVNKAPPQYPWAPLNRPLVEVQLGADVPLAGNRAATNIHPSDRRPERTSPPHHNVPLIWSVSVPVSIDVLNDMFELDTAPVVNSDYWFGIRYEGVLDLTSLGVVRSPSSGRPAPSSGSPPSGPSASSGRSWFTGWPRSVGIIVTPLFHESTHIGDEVAFRLAANQSDYYRINISYEAWEVMLSLDEWQPGQAWAVTPRLGLTGLWNTAGYYDNVYDEELGLPVNSVTPSERRLEYTAELHVVIAEAFPAIGNWVFHGGTSVRGRALFAYFEAGKEPLAWSVNTTFGWYRYAPNDHVPIGLYLRGYWGQMPYGMYRNTDGFGAIGVGLSVGW